MNDNCARQVEIEIENDYQTIPSCNNCATTIVTTRIQRTKKGIVTTSRGFREVIRALFVRIPDPGRYKESDDGNFSYTRGLGRKL